MGNYAMRKNQSKPGIDWAEIEARFNNGLSAYTLAKEYDISRQAINKRAIREGWPAVKHKVKLARAVVKAVRQPEVTKKVTSEVTTEARQPLAIPITRHRHVQKFDKDTVETREAILALLRDGNPKVIATQASGVSLETFNMWLKNDLILSAMVREAESMAVVQRLQNIQKAGNRGDWKADSWYLERTHRETFGSNEIKNGALAVQINIHRDTDKETVTVKPTGKDRPFK